MTKITKPQRAAIADILASGGAVLASQWTSGQGRHTKGRAIPPLCKRWNVNAYAVPSIQGPLPPHVAVLAAKHPRAVAIIAVESIAEAIKETKETNQ